MNKILRSVLTHLVHKIGLHTLIIFGLLCLALLSAAGILQRIVRGLENGAPMPLTFLGLLCGWLLARSRLPGLKSGLVAAMLGLLAVLNHAAELLPKLITLARAAIAFAWQVPGILWNILLLSTGMRALPSETALPYSLQSLDSSWMQSVWQDIYFSLSEILTRLQIWSTGLVSNRAPFDAVVISLLWGLAFWALAVWAAWCIRRRNQPLIGIMPAGAVYIASLSFTGESGLLVIPLLAGAFLLLAASSFTQREKHWQTSNIDYAEDIRFDQAMWAGGMVMLMIVFAGVISSLSPQKFFEALNRLGQERSEEAVQIGESFGLEARPPTPVPAGEPGSGILPRQHLLGSGPELSQQIVMLVQVEGLQAAAGSLPENLPTYYWRGLIYDVYTGHGWNTSITSPRSFQAGMPALPVILSGYYRVRQQFHLLKHPPDTLFHTGLLFSADLDFMVDARPASQTENDYFAVMPVEEPSGSIYRVDSLVQQPSLGQLKAALPDSVSGVDYPEWVAERYLQLPDTLPNSLVSLALELTGQVDSAYEKASAIENYLRQFPYTLDVPEPPPDRDVVEYFLFDLQRGYCDYYATAMVVLARAAGLPARLVTGFATGAFDARLERFVVTANDAHSWAEIYFPGLGWVEFEPTGSRPPFDRPEGIFPLPEIQLGDILPTNSQALWRTILRWTGWIGALLAGSGLLAFLVMVLDAWRLHRLSPQKAFSILYRRLYRHAQRLETPLFPGATPHEFAVGLARCVAALPARSGWQKALQPVSRETHQLIDGYARSIYSPQPAARTDQQQALLTWQALSRRLWLARWLSWRLSLRKRIHKRLST